MDGMTREDLHERLAGLASSVFGCPPSLFTDATRAPAIPRWDSLNHVKLLVAIEDELDLRFTSTDLRDPNDWGEFVDMIAGKLAAREAMPPAG